MKVGTKGLKTKINDCALTPTHTQILAKQNTQVDAFLPTFYYSIIHHFVYATRAEAVADSLEKRIITSH